MRFLLLVSSLAVACFAAPQKEVSKKEVSQNEVLSKAVFDWKAPDFCNGLECPPFEVVEKTKTYEKRQYKQSTWVATKLEAKSYDDVNGILFMKLFDYLNRGNVADMQIDMTAPVLVTVTPGPGPNCPNEFEMHFYISPSISNPPKPSADDVYLKTIKETTVYSRYYPGYSVGVDIIEQAYTLGTTLQKDGKKFVPQPYWYAGYDSPYKLFNRHNEVIFLADD